MKYLESLIEALVEEVLQEQNAISTGGASLASKGSVSATSAGGAWGDNSDVHDFMWSGDGPASRKNKEAKKRDDQKNESVDPLDESDIDEEFKSQAQRRFFYAKADSEGGKWKKWTKEFEDDTPKGKKLPKYASMKKEEVIGKDENGPTYFQMGSSLPTNLYNRKGGKASRDPGIGKRGKKTVEEGWDLSRLLEYRAPRSLRGLVMEALVDTLADKHPEHAEVIRKVNEEIPRKFLQWFTKRYIDNPAEQQAKRLVNVINGFDRLKNQNKIKGSDSDINRYKTVEDLEDIVKKASETMSRKEKKDSEVDILYRDKNMLVASPKTHAASCKLGANTPWCISTPSNDEYWKDYTRKGIHFVIVHLKNKSHPDNRFGIAVKDTPYEYADWDDTEIYDGNDTQVGYSDFENIIDDEEAFNKLESIILGSKYNVMKEPTPAKTEIKTIEELSQVIETSYEEGPRDMDDSFIIKNKIISGLDLPAALRQIIESGYDQTSVFSFTNCTFNGITFPQDLNISVPECELNECVIEVSDMYMKGAVLTGCKFKVLPHLIDLTLENCDLTEIGTVSQLTTVWESANFNGCTFGSAEGVNVYECRFTGCQISGVTWEEFMFTDSSFVNCNITNSRFSNAIYRGTGAVSYAGTSMDGTVIELLLGNSDGSSNNVPNFSKLGANPGPRVMDPSEGYEDYEDDEDDPFAFLDQ